jgi:hypothetical protein
LAPRQSPAREADATASDPVQRTGSTNAQTSEKALLYPRASRATSIDPSWERIRVTGNHPIWSQDRHDYVAAMDLRLGERLMNLSGDTVWVQQKLPRPGPTPVYNLEVQDEHVYYVGAHGVLAHNSTDCDRNRKENVVTVYLSQNGKHVGLEVNGVLRHLVIDRNTKNTALQLGGDFGGYSDFVRISVKNPESVARHSPKYIGRRFKYGENSCVTYVMDALKAGGAEGIHQLPNTLRGGFWDELNKLHVW